MGSEIAVSLAHIQQNRLKNVDGRSGSACGNGRRRKEWGHGVSGRRKEMSSSKQQPVVIGGSILDLTAKIRCQEIMVGDTCGW